MLPSPSLSYAKTVFCGAALAVALLGVLAGVPASAATLLVNGDFETGTLSSFRGTESGSLPGWSVVARYTFMTSYTESGSLALLLNDGIHDNGGGLASITQSFVTVVGEQYRVSAWISANTGASANEVKFIWDNNTLTDWTNLSTSGYEEFSTLVTATSTLSTFSFAYGNDGTGLFVDDIRIVATPEPTRCALVMAGVAMMVLRRRRRA